MKQIVFLIHARLVKTVHAQIFNPAVTDVIGGPNIKGDQVIGQIISALIGIFLLAGFVFAFLHLLFGGIKWITAAGDKTQLQNAQERITQALVGLIILASIWAVMLFAGDFLGITFPKFRVPTFINPGG